MKPELSRNMLVPARSLLIKIGGFRCDVCGDHVLDAIFLYDKTTWENMVNYCQDYTDARVYFIHDYICPVIDVTYNIVNAKILSDRPVNLNLNTFNIDRNFPKYLTWYNYVDYPFDLNKLVHKVNNYFGLDIAIVDNIITYLSMKMYSIYDNAGRFDFSELTSLEFSKLFIRRSIKKTLKANKLVLDDFEVGMWNLDRIIFNKFRHLVAEYKLFGKSNLCFWQYQVGNYIVSFGLLFGLKYEINLNVSLPDKINYDNTINCNFADLDDILPAVADGDLKVLNFYPRSKNTKRVISEKHAYLNDMIYRNMSTKWY